jgi:hypothetical protein
VTERYLGTEAYANHLKIGAFALMALSLLSALLLWLGAKRSQYKQESRYYVYLMIWEAMVILSIAVYSLYRTMMGTKAAPDTLVEKAVLGAWLLLLALGAFLGIGLEIGVKSSGRGELAEPKRVLRSGMSWFTVGLVFSSLVALNYGVSKKDRAFDWSYFKTTKAGEATLNMVSTLDKPVEVAIFFPKTNEVRMFVAEYFDGLAGKNGQLKVEYFDKDLQPGQAEKYKVTQNGEIVMSQGEQQERIEIGDELSEARAKLKKLDSLFQEAFLKLTTEQKTAYFTRGHGEMTGAGAENPLRSVNGLEIVLRSQNYRTKVIEGTNGLLSGIPEDASMIIVAAPVKPFLAEEVEIIKQFMTKGGHVVAFLDSDYVDDSKIDGFSAEDPLIKMFDEMGISFKDERLANEQQYVSASRSPVDKWFIYTNVFSSHESVQNLTRNDDKLQVLMFRAGRLETSSKDRWKNVDTIKALASTFNDLNKNYRFDADTEAKKSYAVAAVGEKSFDGADGIVSSRIAVFADGSVISDFLLRNPGNQLMVLDAFKWVAGEAKLGGEISSEEDVKIMHSRSRELFVFHGSIFLVPALMLGLGFIATRKKRARRESTHG